MYRVSLETLSCGLTLQIKRIRLYHFYKASVNPGLLVPKFHFHVIGPSDNVYFVDLVYILHLMEFSLDLLCWPPGGFFHLIGYNRMDKVHCKYQEVKDLNFQIQMDFCLLRLLLIFNSS